ncbi:hypothetical protein BS17DRAFT_156517 [Gyrodon lividus]|nr:hypothetical protein BS17DRAFT_156517 [Gyrodon lividus]
MVKTVSNWKRKEKKRKEKKKDCSDSQAESTVLAATRVSIVPCVVSSGIFLLKLSHSQTTCGNFRGLISSRECNLHLSCKFSHLNCLCCVPRSFHGSCAPDLIQTRNSSCHIFLQDRPNRFLSEVLTLMVLNICISFSIR